MLKSPCKNIIQTICSDDNLALNSAFNMILEEDEISDNFEEEEDYGDIIGNTDPSLNLENKEEINGQKDLDQSDNEDENPKELKQKIA